MGNLLTFVAAVTSVADLRPTWTTGVCDFVGVLRKVHVLVMGLIGHSRKIFIKIIY